MRKLTVFFVIVFFLSFSGILNAQDVKEVTKEVKKTEQVAKKAKKVKKIKKAEKEMKDCAATCKDKSKCSEEKKMPEKK
jgi:hypothetical protein